MGGHRDDLPGALEPVEEQLVARSLLLRGFMPQTTSVPPEMRFT
ncbi:hypothetical protein [Streptomyces sp. BV286]|nr:hypothetical protein [Streptomyces sp. BV286]